MIPVKQTIYEDPNRMGNCLQACIASLFELPLNAVPHFVESPDFPDNYIKFIEDSGYSFEGSMQIVEPCPYIGMPEEVREYLDNIVGVDGFFIVGGYAKRFTRVQHAVIFKGSKMVHDPHPGNSGIIMINNIDLIVRKQPC
jgi:hypothetical protein